jgi:hypothetical protein
MDSGVFLDRFRDTTVMRHMIVWKAPPLYLGTKMDDVGIGRHVQPNYKRASEFDSCRHDLSLVCRRNKISALKINSGG